MNTILGPDGAMTCCCADVKEEFLTEHAIRVFVRVRETLQRQQPTDDAWHGGVDPSEPLLEEAKAARSCGASARRIA